MISACVNWVRRHTCVCGRAHTLIGGGQCALAALCLAAAGTTKHVLITDGNDDCVHNLRDIVNKNQFGGTF
jgi:hypothetical protein